MILLNCEIYQCGRVSRDSATELIFAHLIRPSGSIPGIGWVGCNQTENKQVSWSCRSDKICRIVEVTSFVGF